MLDLKLCIALLSLILKNKLLEDDDVARVQICRAKQNVRFL